MTPLLIVIALTLGMQQASAPPDVVEELSRLERVWNEAHRKGDAKPLEEVWSDDIEIIIPKMDVLSRAEALEVFRSGRMTFDRYETSGLKIRVYGDAAIVSGDLMRTKSLLGVTTTDHWRFTKTYVRQSGRWRVVNFHASDAER